MPSLPHSRDTYLYAFHRLYCDSAPMEKVAGEVNLHPTLLFKAATGYSNGKDGAIGRACFISWLKGLRSPDGAPCCRARVQKGQRLLVRKPDELQKHQTLQMLEAEAARVLADLERLRRDMGLHPPPDLPDEATLDEPRR